LEFIVHAQSPKAEFSKCFEKVKLGRRERVETLLVETVIEEPFKIYVEKGSKI
jgi:hypothetical protein